MKDRTQPDNRCFAVAGEMRLHQLARRSETASGSFGNIVVANHLFETAGSAHDIRSAICVHGYVTEMPGAPDLAFNQTAFNQHRATNSSSQSQKDHVAKSS